MWRVLTSRDDKRTWKSFETAAGGRLECRLALYMVEKGVSHISKRSLDKTCGRSGDGFTEQSFLGFRGLGIRPPKTRGARPGLPDDVAGVGAV
jgi:hypothetical protein